MPSESNILLLGVYLCLFGVQLDAENTLKNVMQYVFILIINQLKIT